MKQVLSYLEFTSDAPDDKIQKLTEMLDAIDPAFLLVGMANMLSDEKFDMLYQNVQQARTHFENGALLEHSDEGRLKILVNKPIDAFLSHADCIKIGKIVANMTGLNKRSYVGIINFLGASCRIYHLLKRAYTLEKNYRGKRKKETNMKLSDYANAEAARVGKRLNDMETTVAGRGAVPQTKIAPIELEKRQAIKPRRTLGVKDLEIEE